MDATRPRSVVTSAVGRTRQLARLGLTLRGFLATPIDSPTAHDRLRRRVDARDATFLAMVAHLVHPFADSPYSQLLRWAGCAPGDLEATVRAHGVDRALELLRDAGVYVSYAEFRGRAPIVRDGLELPARPGAFDNPLLAGGALGARTSGTSSAPRPVLVSWAGLGEEAAENLVLYECHGLVDARLALWLPPPPGVGGVNFVMVNAKRGRAPDRWFSPVAALPETPLGARLFTHLLPLAGRSVGLRIPRPEVVPFGEEATLAHWLAGRGTPGPPRVLRTSASGAVRVAEAARRDGIDVAGGVVVVGGEPLTPARRRAIEAAGLRAVPHYGASEVGVFAGACPAADACDDMHVYLDRMAVTVQSRELGPGGRNVDALLLTSLSLDGGQVLLNADIGDHADVRRRRCGCPFDELGMDLHLSNVRSHDKLTACGMTLLGGEFDDAVAACVERAGGGPNDYQFWERSDSAGGTRLALAVTPDLPLDEQRFLDCIGAEIRARAPAGGLVAELWRSADTIELVRVRPQPTAALKTPVFVRGGGPPARTST